MDGPLCEGCRTIGQLWSIFLAVAVLGSIAVWWRGWILILVLCAWLFALWDQLGYLYRGIESAYLMHTTIAAAIALVLPIAVSVLRRRYVPEVG